MKTNRLSYIQNILIPCLVFSAAAGVFTGILIFLFKAAASWVAAHSETVYEAVRTSPALIPVLIVGMALVGGLAAIILNYAPEARGGGIPTAITILRGIVPFHWIKSILSVFGSAMLTYFCGVPLGNEGPSVQMGTAVGRGTVALFAKKHPAWDRYIMTGGACAGFAAATGSPITGMLFAFEEAHRRISPMLIMTASMTALTGTATMRLLCLLTDVPFYLFHFSADAVLPLSYLWCAVLVGLLAGLTAAGFTRAYRGIRFFVKQILGRVPFTVKILSVFVLSACVGIAVPVCTGSGHHLIDSLMEGDRVTVALIAVFLVRALLLLLANNADVTGGLFVPTLAFGAILGALSGKLLIFAGILPEEYYTAIVSMGIAAYLGASSRTPLIAMAFSLEALNGITNIIPLFTAVTISFLVIETSGIASFTDTVIESKVETLHHGQKAYVIEADMTVVPGSFACGKEVHDLILPHSCVIMYIQKHTAHPSSASFLAAGDIVHLYIRTFDPTETKIQLESIVGEQTKETYTKISFAKENQFVPE